MYKSNKIFRFPMFVLFLTLGLLAGLSLKPFSLGNSLEKNTQSTDKLVTLLMHIDQDYVEEINVDSIVEHIIEKLNTELDIDTLDISVQ